MRLLRAGNRRDSLKSVTKKTAALGGTTDAFPHPSPQNHNVTRAERMQAATQDRDDRLVDTTVQNPAPDDTGTHDIFDLWRDLGGSD